MASLRGDRTSQLSEARRRDSAVSGKCRGTLESSAALVEAIVGASGMRRRLSTAGEEVTGRYPKANSWAEQGEHTVGLQVCVCFPSVLSAWEDSQGHKAHLMES